MESLKTALVNVGPKVVPFIRTVADDFATFLIDDYLSCYVWLNKWLPVISLIAFALLHAMIMENELLRFRLILTGLLFSFIGEAILFDSKIHIMAGIVIFIIAYMWLDIAFRFRRLKPYAGLICLILALVINYIFTEDLTGVMLPATLVHVLIVCSNIPRERFFDYRWTWTKSCCYAGWSIFIVSDAFLIMNLKSVGPKLVPFFKTVAIYFVVFIPEENISWYACLIKCLPVMSLIAFVLLHGMSLKDEYQYSRRILIGLLFSCLGDAMLLDSKNHLIAGILCFSIAHICYTFAFGFRPLKLFVGLFCLVFALVIYFILTPGLTGVMLPATLVYLLIITVMVWRTIARVQFFDDLWTWTKLCSCAGGIMFFVSDTSLAINVFLKPFPYSQAVIMVTYYLAQLGIALSVVDSMNKKPQKTFTGNNDAIAVDINGHQRKKAN